VTILRTETAVTFTVDPWDPGYGQAAAEDMDAGALTESAAELDLDLELPASRWHPIDPPQDGPLPGRIAFLDGVRRIDARVWVHSAAPQPTPAIAASFAAGLVCCADGAARIAEVAVERGLFTCAAWASGIAASQAFYPVIPADGPALDQLSLALQAQLTDAEVRLAMRYRAQFGGGDDLLVVDGPLRGRSHLERTVGYVKTHHVAYLPAEQAAVVARLRPGQRSPAFTIGTSWRRHSWYLALPGTHGVPWAGVVRLECAPELAGQDVVELAGLTSRVIPPLASSAHKDPRAPQNLVPIGGLERELRHRLGDPRLLYRALRSAAQAGGPSVPAGRPRGAFPSASTAATGGAR
jgi:hypothetical protein